MTGMSSTRKAMAAIAAIPSRSSATAGTNSRCWRSRSTIIGSPGPSGNWSVSSGEKLYGKLPAVREVRNGR